jgi:hypothetical protein
MFARPVKAVALGALVVVVPFAAGAAVASFDDDMQRSDSQVGALPAPPSEEDVDGVIGVLDSDGEVRGYLDTAARPEEKGGVPVFANRDGTGPVVGYMTDFGFVERTEYEAPSFDLDIAREARHAEIESVARQHDPTFDLDRAQHQLTDEWIDEYGAPGGGGPG